VEGGRNVVSAAVTAGATRLLFPSVVWVARQPDGSPFDETAPRHPDRTTQSAADAEDVFREAAQTHDLDVGILRCGFFYAPDSAHIQQFAQNLLSRTLPIIGGGLLGRQDAELSLLHADDAARAFADAVEADATGCWHVVDEDSVTVAELFRAFAEILDAPSPFRVPAWLARPFVGKDTVRLLTQPMPTSNDAFQQEIEWEPMYPTYREGLQQVVETWINDGTLRETPDGYTWTE
jgi:nucleoside-diphosphate-sugar epimerase